MAQSKGSAGRVLLDFETAYKTAKTGANKTPVLIPFNSCDVKATKALQQAATIRNNRNPVLPFLGNTVVGGNLVTPVDTVVIGFLLKALLGAPVTTGAEAPYTHTYKVAATTALPSFVLERGFTDLGTADYQLYGGCKVNSLELATGGDNKELTANFNVVGATETTGSTPYDTSPSPAILDLLVTRFMQSDASATEGGSAVSVLSDFKININNNLDASNFTIGGGGTLHSLPEGIIQVGGSITALFEDTTILAKARAATESSLSLVFTSGASSLTFTFPEVLYELTSPVITGPEGIKATLNFLSYYANGADASAVKVVLVNGRSSYA